MSSLPTEETERILIVNCWDDSNKGDAAITIGTITALKSTGSRTSYSVSPYVVHRSKHELSHAFRHVLSAHPDTILIPCYLPALSRSLNPAAVVYRSLRSLLKLAIPNLIADTELETAVRNSNIVVSNGGLYFGFHPQSVLHTAYHLFAFSYPLLLSRRLKIPYVLYSQSFGPFPSSMIRLWMKWLVGHSSGAWCRESMSRDLLASLSVDGALLDVIPDAAFGTVPEAQPEIEDASMMAFWDRDFIAISLRSLRPSGFTLADEQNYIDSFVEFIEWVTLETSSGVVLVAHTQGPIADEDDRIFTECIYTRLSPKSKSRVYQCDKDWSPSTLCAVYGRAKVVIATRFHAVVLALAGGTPVIAIPYFGSKTQGLFADLDLPTWIMRVEEMSSSGLKKKVQLVLADLPAFRGEAVRVRNELRKGSLKAASRLRAVFHPRLQPLPTNDP